MFARYFWSLVTDTREFGNKPTTKCGIKRHFLPLQLQLNISLRFPGVFSQTKYVFLKFLSQYSSSSLSFAVFLDLLSAPTVIEGNQEQHCVMCMLVHFLLGFKNSTLWDFRAFWLSSEELLYSCKKHVCITFLQWWRKYSDPLFK